MTRHFTATPARPAPTAAPDPAPSPLDAATPVARDAAVERWLGRLVEGLARAARLQPEDAAAPPAPAGARSLPQQQEAAVDALRVWVVEDDEIVALYLGELLRDEGHLVTTFADPRLALQAYRDDPQAVDVVVTDQRMPAITGDVLARALLLQRPRLRIILCTGFSDRLDERGALALGIQHFLRKPFDARALLRAVRGDCGAGG